MSHTLMTFGEMQTENENLRKRIINTENQLYETREHNKALLRLIEQMKKGTEEKDL